MFRTPYEGVRRVTLPQLIHFSNARL